MFHGLMLGGAKFVERLRRKVTGNAREQPGLKELTGRVDLDKVIGVVERLKGEGWEQFRDRYGDSGRDLVLWLGRKRCGLKLIGLAERVGGLDYTSVSLAVKRFEKRRLRDKSLQRLVEQAEKALKLE